VQPGRAFRGSGVRPATGPGTLSHVGFQLDRRRFIRWASAATALGAGWLGVGWLGCRGSDATSGDAPEEAPGGVDPAADGGAPLAWRVHRATRNTLAGALGQALWPHGSPPARAKPYPGHERTPLPDPPPHVRTDEPDAAAVVRGFAPAPALAASELALEELARLLHLAYGVTGHAGIALRAAPSAGALYAGEVYVVAARVAGLAPGVYSYHAPSHALVHLARGPGHAGRVADALERPGLLARAPASVLLTNVFHRYTHRYRNRGYRYALIDSGHIGENLRLAAAARGLGVVTPLRFHDDALNDLLGVDGREEAVCALHAVGRAASGEPSGASDPSEGATPRARAFVEAGPRAACDDASLPLRYHTATKLAPGAPREAVAAPAAEPARAPAGPASALPEPATPGAGVAWSIRERRSARRFREEPIAPEALAALLAMARGSQAARLAHGLELRVVVHRVAGLARGVYRYAGGDRRDAAGARLVRVRAGDAREALHDACLRQDKAATAAVACAMVADVGAAAARGGDRAYRDLLLGAGAMGQRLYVGAEAFGLAARNLAAFLDDRLNDLLGVAPGRRAVVHLTLLGPGD